MHKRIFTRRLVSLMVAVSWLFAVGYMLGVYSGIALVINGVCFIGYNWPTVGVYVSLVGFVLRMVIPIGCYAVCYVLIMISLKRKTKVKTTIVLKTSGVSKPNGAVVRSFSKARSNVAITLFCTVVIHVLAWSGNQIQVLMSTAGYQVDTSGALFQLLQLAVYASSCVNPIIYSIKYKEFRLALSRMLLCKIVGETSSIGQEPEQNFTQGRTPSLAPMTHTHGGTQNT